VLSFVSREGTPWVCGGKPFVVSARTNKRQHHHGLVVCSCTRVETLAFWGRFTNERNQGKQAHPASRVPVMMQICDDRGNGRGNEEDDNQGHFRANWLYYNKICVRPAGSKSHPCAESALHARCRPLRSCGRAIDLKDTDTLCVHNIVDPPQNTGRLKWIATR
jgi:hypothetical protein